MYVYRRCIHGKLATIHYMYNQNQPNFSQEIYLSFVEVRSKICHLYIKDHSSGKETETTGIPTSQHARTRQLNTFATASVRPWALHE